MSFKRRVLGALGKDELLAIGRGLELEVTTRASVLALREAIAKSKRATIGAIVQESLSRDTLKEICIALGLDDTGKEKSALVERIHAAASKSNGYEIDPGSTQGSRAIPKNVFVIGTVNVDETTYMFSPKVLDRAFVLEFNDVDLKGLGGEVHAESAASTPLALVNLEGGLKLRGRATDAEWKRFEGVLNGEASALLHRIHAALAIENRHFGYRVAREVARFVDLAVEQAGESDAAARAALDVAVLAKILPKLHGSQAEIEQTLKRLMSIALDGKHEADVFSEYGTVLDPGAIPLPRTARKLWRMQSRLRSQGFVSFIE